MSTDIQTGFAVGRIPIDTILPKHLIIISVFLSSRTMKAVQVIVKKTSLPYNALCKFSDLFSGTACVLLEVLVIHRSAKREERNYLELGQVINIYGRYRISLPTDPEVRVRFPALPDFLRSSKSGTGSTQPREYN
jgi:hypothetical protein